MSDTAPAFSPFLAQAMEALSQSDRARAAAALAQAFPLLKEDVLNGVTFLGVVSEQATLMAVRAGEVELAWQFATLTLWDAARELVRLAAEYQRCIRSAQAATDPTERESTLESARAVIADMYGYAVGFVPMVQGQTLVPLGPLGEGLDSKHNAGAAFIMTQVRPELDDAGWGRWPYEEQTARVAAHWSAFALVHQGNQFLENGDSGRDVEDAERLTDGALRLIPESERDQLMADAFSLKARVLARYGAGQIDAAIALAEEARGILDALPNPPAAAAERANIGAYYHTKSGFAASNDDPMAADALARAERYLREAVTALRTADPDRRLGGALANLGIVLSERHADDASATLREAHDAIPDIRQNFELRAKIALNIGSLFSDAHRDADALPWFQKSIDAFTSIEGLSVDPEVPIMAYGGAGVSLWRTVGPQSAEPRLTQALDVIETYRRSFYSERANAVLLKRFRWVYEAAISCDAALGENDPSRRSRAFELAERIKWRQMTTLLRFLPLAMVDEQQEPQLLRERQLLDFLKRRLLGEPSLVRRDTEVVGAMKELEAIWTDLESRYPEYVAMRREETATGEFVAAALDDEVSVLVEYYLGDQYGTSLAFVIRRGDAVPSIVRLPESPWRIGELVRALRDQTAQLPVAAYRDAAAALHRAVFEPLQPFVPEGAGVCIVPYGELHNAPFAGLWDGRRYLFQRNPLTVAASASALRWWIGKDRGKLERCLLFTATAAITEGTQRLADLTLFGDVAKRQIQPLFEDSTLIAGAEATKDALLHALDDAQPDAPDVVHIACHGIAKTPGLLSCLVMAGASEAKDKDLTALEIATHLRLAATLVTLSACDSAITETSTGDEVAGLATSFLMAGASAVLGTLWEVRQDATVAITRGFYRRLRGESGGRCTKIAALREAVTEASRRPNWLQRIGGIFGLADDLSHPYLWSTFQLYGNWR
jgi:CHAT domain-containing protein/tetratricopeptide (TPR) repeat protein